MADRALRLGRFYPLAYYVTKRIRAHWLALPDTALVALVDALPGRRLVVSFGGTRQRAQQPSKARR